MKLLSQGYNFDKGQGKTQDRFIPLVLTGDSGLPWNLPVYERTKERLAALGFPAAFCSSVALITPRDLSMLEHAGNLGHSVIEILKSWRRDHPAHPLDTHFQMLGIPINVSKWERDRVRQVITRFTTNMNVAG